MALMYTPRKHYTSRHCVFQMVRAQRQLFELLVVHPEECSDASYVLVTAMVFAKGAQLEHGGLDDCKQCESALLVLECTCRTAHTHHAIWADLGLDRRYRNSRIPRMCVLQRCQKLIFSCTNDTWSIPCRKPHHAVDRSQQQLRRQQPQELGQLPPVPQLGPRQGQEGEHLHRLGRRAQGP